MSLVEKIGTVNDPYNMCMWLLLSVQVFFLFEISYYYNYIFTCGCHCHGNYSCTVSGS